jgi:hypothetical protein
MMLDHMILFPTYIQTFCEISCDFILWLIYFGLGSRLEVHKHLKIIINRVFRCLYTS